MRVGKTEDECGSGCWQGDADKRAAHNDEGEARRDNGGSFPATGVSGFCIYRFRAVSTTTASGTPPSTDG